ncbi:transcriptional regulator [Archaeoglobus veneficus]|uniref:Putative HTH-type transcriptional regulatory protein Arcve_1573 n=1 Tax=Archaeoglobus veneficus (strain DSM 11195 / SNP6) TaxID=693661 RepID=F2KPP5_ARCVS|nr:transcriptional regulator [Archaeoglobus veneficus]AEA47573.1 transcriptional regulator, XRE family [Archaeoglobus veneficus SNP6]
MHAAVVESILRILDKAGFRVTDLVETKPRCFDIVARKDEIVMLIKVLYNVDSLKAEMAEEMKLVAKLLKASPVVVGERFKFDYLERGVVYNRYGLPVINTATFYDFVVEGIPPMVYSAPGGYYVRLDSERIREARQRLGISIGELAKMLGVSRRAIKKYEEGVDTSVENAVKLEEFLGEYVIKAIDILNFVKDDVEPKEDVELRNGEAEIVEQLRCIGVNVYPIKHAPFDVVSKTGDEAVLTGVKQVREIERRAAIIGKVSEVLSTKAAYIVEKEVKKGISSVVFLMKEELACVSSPKDFITLLNEKKSTERNI